MFIFNCNAECHYAECRFDDCHGALFVSEILNMALISKFLTIANTLAYSIKVSLVRKSFVTLVPGVI